MTHCRHLSSVHRTASPKGDEWITARDLFLGRNIRRARSLGSRKQVKRGDGEDFCRGADFGERVKVLVGMGQTEIAGAEHDRFNAAAVEKAGLQRRGGVESLCLPLADLVRRVSD